MPVLRGTPGDDTLPGTSGADRILAGAGSDLILGDGRDGPHPAVFRGALPLGLPAGNMVQAGAGNDTVLAGYGADTVWGGAGDDLIRGWGVLAAQDPVGEALARDADLGDLLHGGRGRDTLLGGGGDDVLDGSLGDDRLVGGVGADTLFGGAGRDVFAFGALDARARLPVHDTRGDIVVDFTEGEDRLDLAEFARRLPGVALDVLADTGFTDPAHLQVRSVVSGANTLVEIHLPGTASLGVDATILLLGEHHLAAGDVLFA